MSDSTDRNTSISHIDYSLKIQTDSPPPDVSSAEHSLGIALPTHHEEQPLSDEEKANVKSSTLIRGFTITNGDIISEESGACVEDIEIEALGLSMRAYNALMRFFHVFGKKRRIPMVSDLLMTSEDSLRSIRNMGEKTADEIINKLSMFLFQKTNPGSVFVPEIGLAPRYTVKDGIISCSDTDGIVPDVPISYLGLSVRAMNSLQSEKILYLSQLVSIPLQRLRLFSQMGQKTFSEIEKKVPEYLESHTICEETPDAFQYTNPKQIPDATESTQFGKAVLPGETGLATDYTVISGLIYSIKTLNRIPNQGIDVLDLSYRSANCLRKMGKCRITDLVAMSYSQLMGIRNLGVTSANEIQNKLVQYLSKADIMSYDTPESDSSAGSAIKPEVFLLEQRVLYLFYNRRFSELGIDTITKELNNPRPELLEQAIKHLVQICKLGIGEEGYHQCYPSFVSFVAHIEELAPGLLDDRLIRILRARIAGSTLEEIGDKEGISRERVRQIEKQANNKIYRKEDLIFAEDRLGYLYSTYAFDIEFYRSYLGESSGSIYYLSGRYAEGTQSPETAVEDSKIPVDIRRQIDRWLHRDCIFTEGRYIPFQRGAIEDYIIEKHCQDGVTIDEFFDYYEAFLVEHAVTDISLQLTDSVRRTRKNRLSESNLLLWRQNSRLRYYDIVAGDYSELLETLNLGQYTDIELSTQKFMLEYPDLMARYDIRDEYELHNLLKKIHAEKENHSLIFERMPNMRFGSFDRDNAVKELLFAVAPISQDNFAAMLSEEYGTREETIKANWLGCISSYYHRGSYSIEYKEMPEEQMHILMNALPEDCYFLSELRKIYSQLIFDADYSLLSTFNLKRMGFHVCTNYVIKNYASADAYFSYLLTSQDILDATRICKRYTGVGSFSSCFDRIRRERTIIEFEPYQYIHTRRLEKMGVEPEQLNTYCDQVWGFLNNDDYFSIHSIRQEGFVSDLDQLGFGECFYASLLKEDNRFSWQRIGNTVIFNPKAERFSMHDFLESRIAALKVVNVKQFVENLLDTYGVSCDRYRIIEKVRGGHCYYDSITDTLFSDYGTYLEHVSIK